MLLIVPQDKYTHTKNEEKKKRKAISEASEKG